MEKKVPVKGKRNILITSALPYVNNVPHLGNIIGAVLSADVYSRYCKLKGYNSIYICGTDEYGTATETKALKEGLTPMEICNKYHKIHKSVYEWFNIDFDYFGRTTTKLQTKIAQDIFWKVHRRHNTREDKVYQLYCEECKMPLADRYVNGECPLCNYEDARGDQCDMCGKLLNAIDLIKPKCSICKKSPVTKSTQHLFLKLPELSKDIETWKDESIKSGGWSTIAKSITNSWIKEGLKNRCITRDLKWGTPVPLEKFKDKVFYVWFDAPIGYISITANYTDEWEKWWKNPKDVELVQFMGKDNVPFHSVIFPGTLIATGEKWTLVNKLSATEYLNYESGKFSKSRNTGIFGDTVQKTGIPAMVWRYYLLTNRPETSDTVFNWNDFASKNNNELLNNLGNYVNRVLKFTSAKLGGTVPDSGLDFTKSDPFTDELDVGVINKINANLVTYISKLEDIKLKEGLHCAMTISKICNGYLQATKPWVLMKKNIDRCKTVMYLNIQIVYLLVYIFEPYMPNFSKILKQQLNISLLKIKKDAILITDSIQLTSVPVGHKLGKIDPIFKKISPDQITNFRDNFSGPKVTPDFPLNVKIGKIVQVLDHPRSTELLVMKIDVGERAPRTIVGKIKEFYSKEQLTDKIVCVVCNLRASKLAGVKSYGMLFAAVSETKGKKVVSLLTPSDVSKVTLGSTLAPKKTKVTLSKVVKKKDLGKILKILSTSDKGLATYGGELLVIQDTEATISNDKKLVKVPIS